MDQVLKVSVGSKILKRWSEISCFMLPSRMEAEGILPDEECY
jgi:hypothetical protein